MKKIEWQGEKICTECGYSSGKFPCYDGIDFCPICGIWGDAIVPINAESCNICHQPIITASDRRYGLCYKCFVKLLEEAWDKEYWKEIEEKLASESVSVELKRRLQKKKKMMEELLETLFF